MSVNLLPPEHRATITYARQNSTLKNWIIASSIGVVGLVLVFAGGLFFLNQSTTNQQRQVTELRKQLADQKQGDVEKQVSSISSSIKLTLQVLQRQIFFSKLITQVGSVMPNSTSLESLALNSAQNGIDLTATATDYQSATQVQINITDPSKKLFDKADIINVSCGEPSTSYPCKISLRAAFAKDSGYQFTTIPGATK